MRIKFTSHARSRMQERKGIEPTSDVVKAIQKAVADDIHHWPEGVSECELEIALNGEPMRLVIAASNLDPNYDYVIKTILFKNTGSIKTRLKRADRKNKKHKTHMEYVEDWKQMKKRKYG